MGLSNGNIISSTATGTLQTPHFAIPAHIFPDKSLDRSLNATVDYCNQGCTVIYTGTSVTVIHDATGEIVTQASKRPEERLWPVDTDTLPPQATTHNVVRHEIDADIVSYAHAAFCSPPDSSMYKALCKGWLGNYPGVTAATFYANKPNSTATAKGHLDQRRQKNKRRKFIKPTIPGSSSHISSNQAQREDTAYSNIATTKVLKSSDLTNYSDMPGRFPYISYRGYEYMLVSVYRGAIHVELMKNRSATEYVRAYRETFEYYKQLGHTPLFQKLDNESSDKLEAFLEKEAKVKVEYVPASNHRRNRAERAIRDWKNHFISCLATVDPDFPMAYWCELVEQAELTINHLREWSTDSRISAYAGIHGAPFDFVAHPIHPPGTKIVVLEPTGQRETWAPHGLDGFYLGPCLKHHQTYWVYITATNSIRNSDSISWHPSKLRLPGSSREDLLYAKASDIYSHLQSSADAKTNSTLCQLASDMHALMLQVQQQPQQQQQRVLPVEIDPCTTQQAQRVLPVEIDPCKTQPAQRVGEAATYHPTSSRSRARKKASRQHAEQADKYTTQAKLRYMATHRVFFDYVGKGFTDTDDNIHFQITKVVIPIQSPKGKAVRPFYRYFDTAKFTSAPVLEADYEHTPCAEMIIWSRKDKCHKNHPKYLRWDTTAQAYSTFHSSPSDPLLNVTSDGKPLTHRRAINGPDGSLWMKENGKEIERLIMSETIRPIFKRDQPTDRRKDTTYYNPQVKEKLDHNKEKTRRVRGTLGGDRLNYDGPTSSPVADIAVIKLLLHSVVSDRLNHGTNTRFATIDLSDFYLESKLPRADYVRIAVKHIPDDILTEYDLHKYIDNGHILFQVDGAMYGHPAAGRLANSDLVSLLHENGYIQDPDVPSLFENPLTGLVFTLVVDDLGVKYNDIRHLEDLKRVLNMKWKTKVDLSGQKYVGMRIEWHYDEPIPFFYLDMPTTVPAAIARFYPNGPPKGTHTPGIYVAPNFKSPDLGATVDTSPPASTAERKFIMEVTGVFLFYARMIDHMMLPTTTFISKKQAAPTKNTLAATHQLLRYAIAHPNHKVKFTACDMTLIIQSDGSHLSQEQAGSIAGGAHYCGNKTDGQKIMNGLILPVCSSIRTVCASASETEYASLFINAQHAYFERVILERLHYPQEPTVIYADNNTAVGIANDTVKLRRSKAIDMRYHWIRDRVRRKVFRVVWSRGKDNDADFFTKIQPRTRHEFFTRRFVCPPTP